MALLGLSTWSMYLNSTSSHLLYKTNNLYNQLYPKLKLLNSKIFINYGKFITKRKINSILYLKSSIMILELFLKTLSIKLDKTMIKRNTLNKLLKYMRIIMRDSKYQEIQIIKKIQIIKSSKIKYKSFKKKMYR